MNRGGTDFSGFFIVLLGKALFYIVEFFVVLKNETLKNK